MGFKDALERSRTWQQTPPEGSESLPMIDGADDPIPYNGIPFMVPQVPEETRGGEADPEVGQTITDVIVLI